MLTHNLGYPRIGKNRELKKGCEKYWAGDLNLNDLLSVGRSLRAAHWLTQRDAGIDLIPVNDFSFYDHVLDLTQMLRGHAAALCTDRRTPRRRPLFRHGTGLPP